MALAPTLRFQRTRPQYSLICASRYRGNSVWTYEIENGADHRGRLWTVRARPVDTDYDGVEWYEIVLRELDHDRVVLSRIHNRLHPGFHGLGIGPLLLRDVARRLRRRVMSAPSTAQESAECRSERTNEIWQYLVLKGQAARVSDTSAFEIDGRDGVGWSPVVDGPLKPSIAPPTNELEFQALMEKIDTKLKNEGVPVVGRELSGGAELFGWLGETMILSVDPGIPLPGIYDGIDLYARTRRWFKDRYGRKLEMNLSPGRVALLIKGDVWTMNLPLLIGSHRLFASRTRQSDSGALRADDGVPSLYNVLDSIDALPAGLTASLSDDELSQCLEVFRTALAAHGAMRDCAREQFVPEARSDHEATVGYLTGASPHAGQARWAALQATEKMYKSYLVVSGKDVPKSHNLSRLSELAATAGLIPADPFFLAAVQCPVGVRYGESPSSIEEAVSAHHAALELSWYIGDEIRRAKQLPRRAI